MRVIGKNADAASATGSIHAKLAYAIAQIAALAIGAVPAQNAADNVDVADVVGNKTDTTAGTSLVALLKQILAYFGVPVADAAANVDTCDVVGNKTDTVAGTSLVALAKQVLAAVAVNLTRIRIPRPTLVRGYPLAAAGATITGHANPWTVGNWAEVAAAGVITADCVLVGLSIDTPSDAAIVGSIDISHTNAVNTMVAQGIPFEVASDAGLMRHVPVPPGITIPSGSNIEARLQTAAGGGETVAVKVLVQAIS